MTGGDISLAVHITYILGVKKCSVMNTYHEYVMGLLGILAEVVRTLRRTIFACVRIDKGMAKVFIIDISVHKHVCIKMF